MSDLNTEIETINNIVDKQTTTTNKLAKRELQKQDSNKVITMFNVALNDERIQALASFFQGATPRNEIRKRTGRGGGQVDFVNGYWMFRQATLLTNSRWWHEKTGIKFRPDELNPAEITVYVNVTFEDYETGKTYTHPGTGSKDVARYKEDTYKKTYVGKEQKFIDLGIDITDTTWQQEKRKQRHLFEIEHHKGEIISLGDDEKAAETDAIKKALSYFGIANDVYGHKEKKFIDPTSEEENNEDGESEEVELDVKDRYKKFGIWLKLKGLLWSEVYEILGTKEIADYEVAKQKIMEVKGIKE
jgi:hypothetical protein